MPCFFLAKTDLQFVGLGSKAVLRCKNVCAVVDARCYFENVVFPKANASLFCHEHGGVIVMNHCEISAGSLSCEDYPDCIGGLGCISKPTCDRSRKIGDPNSQSGIWGSPGVRIFNGAFGLMENSVIHHCGGAGVVVEGEQSHLVVRKCEVYRNHLFGLSIKNSMLTLPTQSPPYTEAKHFLVLVILQESGSIIQILRFLTETRISITRKGCFILER